MPATKRTTPAVSGRNNDWLPLPPDVEDPVDVRLFRDLCTSLQDGVGAMPIDGALIAGVVRSAREERQSRDLAATALAAGDGRLWLSATRSAQASRSSVAKLLRVLKLSPEIRGGRAMLAAAGARAGTTEGSEWKELIG